MIDEKTIKQVVTIILISILFIFTFLMIRPIFMAILFGLVLAYILNPFDKMLLSKIKHKSITSLITCSISIIILFLFVWFLIPVLINQVFDAYMALQSWDVTGFMEKFFPFIFNTPQAKSTFIISYNNFVSNSVKAIMDKLTEIIIDLPSLLLKGLVVLIVLFYSLRDGDKMLKLMHDTLPFNKELTDRFIKRSKQVTFSVVFGRLVIGILTGILTGASFYLAGVNNALLLTLIAILASIIPIIGPWAVWIPVVIGLFIAGKTLTAVLLLIYCGIFISFIDNFLHAVIISKKTHIPTSLTLIGLIGGIFVFGIFGIILGPLLISYLATLFEIYREHNVKSTD